MGKTSEDRKEEKNRKKGRISCFEREGLRRGAWTAEEDKILVDYITENGHGTWTDLPKLAGLFRCGKSCRLRWTNYLRPDIKRGPFSPDEENTIIQLHESLGNKWAAIASHLPGRTDNDVKNFWNSHLRKRFSNKTLDNPTSSSDRAAAKSKPNVRLDRHMARQESVCLSANPPCPLNFAKGDYYLNLWNSEIGTSFRKVNSTSQTSSVTKVESGGKNGAYWVPCGKEAGDVAAAHSDTSSKWCEDQTMMMQDDSLEAMMSLLLDFPIGDYSDMEIF